jgi:hypothetical protein
MFLKRMNRLPRMLNVVIHAPTRPTRAFVSAGTGSKNPMRTVDCERGLFEKRKESDN